MIHIEKIIIMKKSIIIFILMLFLQSNVKANDISEYQIEGISVGESLLNFMTEEEIINKRKSYYKDKFVAILVRRNDLENYEYLQFVFKPNDKKYIIHSVEGHIDYPDNFQNCLKQRKIIDKELANSYLDIVEIVKQDNQTPNYDKTGKTKSFNTEYYLKDGHVRVSCTNYSDELTKNKGWYDDLKVVVNSQEFTEFLTKDW